MRIDDLNKWLKRKSDRTRGAEQFILTQRHAKK